ncbi:aldo/keto reductase family oxidoreductase [Shewanella maritima]|uniref:aldo/keto reductase n=1 Tax=Shewanella maritima TaxID=2520507 RepID=UPI003736578D
MKRKLPLGEYLPEVSDLVYGCMGLGGNWDDNLYDASHVKQANTVIDSALTAGINLFDHADIYRGSKAETVFGEALKQRGDRGSIFIQSKCGIRFDDDLGPKRYDLSAAWITSSVEQSLQRLSTDYLDILLLHRPDPLMQVSEVADAFNALKQAGKVRYLGVSNMHWPQVQQLQRAINAPIVVNQMHMSLHNHAWVDETLYAGESQGSCIHFSPGTVEYCNQHKVQLQSWGSLAQGLFSGASLEGESQATQATAKLVEQLSNEYQVSPEAIVLAWLMRHPANIQPVIGTTSPQRILACSQASKVQLSREHWYALFVSAKGLELP